MNAPMNRIYKKRTSTRKNQCKNQNTALTGSEGISQRGINSRLGLKFLTTALLWFLPIMPFCKSYLYGILYHVPFVGATMFHAHIRLSKSRPFPPLGPQAGLLWEECCGCGGLSAFRSRNTPSQRAPQARGKTT